jgi:IPT/TIG domain/NHL repeat
MKTLKKIFTILCIIIMASCSKNEDTPTPEPNPVAISSMGPTTGPKNTAVVITGRGFSDNAISNIVTLNGKPCLVNQASTTQLNITIPPAAGTGNIKITVAGNSAQSTTFTFIDTIVVSTIAGSAQGFADGIGTAARFDGIIGISIDQNGNLYVADRDNDKIRKITPSGVVTSLLVNSGQIDDPRDVVLDATGNVYVASGSKILKISSTGVISTLAGDDLSGNSDGIGTTARFYNIFGIDIDQNNNIYVADGFNNNIRKISPTGVVTTVAGSGTAGFVDGTTANAQFNYPRDVAVGLDGTLYVSDYGNNRVRKISTSGIVSTIAGNETLGFADGQGTNAIFRGIAQIEIDINNNLYIADYGNHKVRKISPNGNVITIAGIGVGYVDGDASIAKFSVNEGIAVDNNGNLYVSDRLNNKIRKITID